MIVLIFSRKDGHPKKKEKIEINKLKRNTNKLDGSFRLPYVCPNLCKFSRGASALSNGLSSVDKEEKFRHFEQI